MMHKELCSLNHTDGCGWYYEDNHEDTWSSSNHGQYMAMARKLVQEQDWTEKYVMSILEKFYEKNRIADTLNDMWYPAYKETRGW